MARSYKGCVQAASWKSRIPHTTYSVSVSSLPAEVVEVFPGLRRTRMFCSFGSPWMKPGIEGGAYVGPT